MFKHLVISGGSVWGFYAYGAIREAAKRGELDLYSVYGTSIGALLGAVLCLNISFDALDDYFIRRPWHQVLQQSTHNLFEVYQTRGIIDGAQFFDAFFEPLLKSIGKDLSLTLGELYEISKKELYVYSMELNRYELVELSYKTHPEWRVVDAVRASCSLPMLFTPLIIPSKHECWVDGAIMCNYPIKQALTRVGRDADYMDVLGISLGNLSSESMENENPVVEASSFVDFASVLFTQIFKHSMFSNPQGEIKNEILFFETEMGYDVIMRIASSPEARRVLIDEGSSMYNTTIHPVPTDSLLSTPSTLSVMTEDPPEPH